MEEQFIIEVTPSGKNKETKLSISELDEVNNHWYLKCLKPLTFNMRIFGLYFENLGDAQSSTNWRKSPGKFLSERCFMVYPTFVLTLLWLNVFRMMTVFTNKDKIGMTLFWKLIVFTWSAMATVMHTSSYMACKSGKLHRLLLEISRKDGGLRNLRHRAIMTSLTGWALVIVNVCFAVYQYLYIPQMLDIFIAPITTWICPGNVSAQKY